jgi:hypothetical protein
MERETLLTLLLLLFGGLAMQPLAPLPRRPLADEAPRIAERSAWLRLWLPVAPTLVVGAWLCGWALREPDPVQARFDHGMLIAASLPFALVALRAALRAAWALVREPAELPICTAGLWRPRILFSPLLARALDEGQIRAALEHERAHARHRDPLRIWLAQLATDLQWPWPWAQERFEAWLEILECARDDEARDRGADGIDLAAAVLTIARRSSPSLRPRGTWWAAPVDAALLGDAQSLQLRIARLLSPLPEADESPTWAGLGPTAAFAMAAALLSVAAALGAAYGNTILHPFFVWTWTV